MFDWFWKFLYMLYVGIAGLIDFFLDIFRILAGLQKVEIRGEEKDLLSHLLTTAGVSTAFWTVVIIAIVLLFLATIIAILRMQFNNEGGTTTEKILGSAGKAFLMFFIIPIIMGVTPLFVNTVVGQIDNATNPHISATETGRVSIGGQILVTIGENAWKDGLSDAQKEEYRYKFIMQEEGFSYLNAKDVAKYYDLSEMNYGLAYIAAVLFLVVFASSLIPLVERIINIVVLYVIAPLPMAASVLDEGARYKLWRDQLMVKFLSAFGIIVALNIYLLMAPIIQGLNFNVAFYGSKTPATIAFTDGIIKLLFLIGAAFAVKKAPVMIGNLIVQGAGSQEQADRAHSNQAFSKMAKGAVGVAGKAAKAGAGKAWESANKGRKERKAMLNNMKNSAKLHDKAQKQMDAGKSTRLTRAVEGNRNWQKMTNPLLAGGGGSDSSGSSSSSDDKSNGATVTTRVVKKADQQSKIGEAAKKAIGMPSSSNSDKGSKK